MINRRSFLKLGAALPMVALVPALPVPVNHAVNSFSAIECPISIPWFYTEILDTKSMNADWMGRMKPILQNMRETQDRIIYETLMK